MSKNALILERTATPEPVSELPRAGEYRELIRRHVHPHSSIALIAAGPSRTTGSVSQNLARELAAFGKRVVIVSGSALLQNPGAAPEESACTATGNPGVWSWPSTAGFPVEFFKSGIAAAPAGPWLDSLRHSFDAVLLDCPAVVNSPATSNAASPAAAELAALADAAVLVVEAGLTSKQQIRRSQRALQLRGVKLIGCILMDRR